MKNLSRQFLLIKVACVSFLLQIAPSTFSQTARQATHTFVISVGINNYQYLPKLRYAESDSAAIADVFSKRGAATKVLLGSAATPQSIYEATTSFVSDACPGDTIVFYFAGHAYQANGSGPADGPPEVALATANSSLPGTDSSPSSISPNHVPEADDLSWTRLINILRTCPARNLVLLFDTPVPRPIELFSAKSAELMEIESRNDLALGSCYLIAPRTAAQTGRQGADPSPNQELDDFTASLITAFTRNPDSEVSAEDLVAAAQRADCLTAAFGNDQGKNFVVARSAAPLVLAASKANGLVYTPGKRITISIWEVNGQDVSVSSEASSAGSGTPTGGAAEPTPSRSPNVHLQVSTNSANIMGTMRGEDLPELGASEWPRVVLRVYGGSGNSAAEQPSTAQADCFPRDGEFEFRGTAQLKHGNNQLEIDVFREGRKEPWAKFTTTIYTSANGTPALGPRTDRALIIGTGTYDDAAHYIPLPNPPKDAQALGELLSRRFNFQVDYLVPSAKAGDVLDKIDDYMTKIPWGPDDQLLIFFAGHGCTIPIEGTTGPGFDPANALGYLVEKDSIGDETKRARERKLVDLIDLRGHLERIGCRHVLVLIDSCHGGAFAGNGTSLISYSSSNENALAGVSGSSLQDQVARLLEQPCRRYFASGGTDFVVPDGADDDPNHSPFASQILKLLSDPERQLITDGDIKVALAAKDWKKYHYPGPVEGYLGNDQGGSFVFVDTH